MLGGVGESVPQTFRVGEAFGEGPFGDDAVMPPKVDVIIIEAGEGGVAGDGNAVDEAFRKDQPALDKDGVAAGDEQVARRDLVAKCRGADADGPVLDGTGIIDGFGHWTSLRD